MKEKEEGPLSVVNDQVSVEATKNFDSSKAPELTDKEKQKLMNEQLLRIKQQKKFEEEQIREYKKELTKSVELKRLQVESLHLDIQYIRFKQELKDLQPVIDKLEADERARMEEEAKPVGPKIDVVKQGKPRGK